MVNATNDLKVTSQAGGVVVLNEDFQEGDFGISIIDEPGADPGSIISGDLQLVPAESWEFQYDSSGNAIRNAKIDSLGNAICDANTPAPGQNDYLYDSMESDHLLGGGGDDSLNALRGGSDILEGGSGSDLLTDFGDNDNDQLFAEHYGEVTALVNAGEVAENLTGKGDLLAARGGDDMLFGSDRGDALFLNLAFA